MEVPVKIYFQSGKIAKGTLAYTIKGPTLVSEESDNLLPTIDSSILSVLHDISAHLISLKSEVKFEFKSKSTERKYSLESYQSQEMYPPSTNGWVKHLSESGVDALYSVQKIIGEDRFLLSVVDLETEEILRMHPIQAYEANILFMETDWEKYTHVVDTPSSNTDEIPLTQILNMPPPSLRQLAILLDGVEIPEFKRGSNMRDTMEQLIPKSFPPNIRLELMAFLAYVSNLKIPKEDPLDYQVAMRERFKSAPLLRLLVYSHIQCLLEGLKPPQYVRMMTLVDRGMTKSGLEPAPIETNPWAITWHRLMEMFPDRKNTVALSAKTLNQSGKIITSLPISRNDSKKSRKAWNDRFSMIRNGLMMRAYVQERGLGLVKLAFLGATHRWPHRHLAWSARLGNPENKPPYMQVMVLPPFAAETITRLREKMAYIDWSSSRVNYGLFDQKRGLWKTNLAFIQRAFSGSRTSAQVSAEFNQRNMDVRKISSDEARVLDLVSFGIYLSSMELGAYDNILGMSRNTLKRILQSFQEQGIIQLQYLSYLSDLVSICLEIRGDVNQLYSIARASMKHLPSSNILVSERNSLAYMLVRVPEKSAYEILKEYPSRASDSGISMKCYRVTAYVDYMHNLHQRLLRPDGSWDDDISDLLSQIRS